MYIHKLIKVTFCNEFRYSGINHGDTNNNSSKTFTKLFNDLPPMIRYVETKHIWF